ncbi:MAG: DUF1800 domain-containing protein [Janthinobacterium lividum]
MKLKVKLLSITMLIIGYSLLFSSFLKEPQKDIYSSIFPYKKAGLTQRQAVAHLLSRFTYGATPSQVDAVVQTGLERWFNQQLDASMPDDSLNQLLHNYDALKLTNTQIVNIYPKAGQAVRMAVKDGFINKDSVNKTDRKKYKDQLAAYMQQKGLKPEQELFRQFINQKILRAVYTNNQLREVLTDFWFNHFNVSITKNDCARFIPAYERDVIRPNSLGKFDELLLATAKSPAMLYFLDNFSSSGTNTNLNNNQAVKSKMQMRFANQQMGNMQDSASRKTQLINKIKAIKKASGLNENYAREVMELHTLGVDGGYTQQDVTQAAQVLTGWTVYLMGDNDGAAIKKMIDQAGEDKLEQRGFVHEGDFLFASNRHDNSEKTVLGKHFGPDGGYQEGVQLLEMLAHHPSTAHFICQKIAGRFVSDNPPKTLIDKMVKTFLQKDGNIKQLLITMVAAPEFWSAASVREKTKSPFELAISSVRSLNADINQPYQLYNWINRMGQKMYYYQAPTGFPDKGQYWINTGALLNRMNFGLALAANRIPGIKIDLAALNNHHEPESVQAALVTYSKMVMPERNLDATIKRLSPMLEDPGLSKKVEDATAKTAPVKPLSEPGQEMVFTNEAQKKDDKNSIQPNKAYVAMQSRPGNNSMLSQVVGVIIGSPEFQRR